MKWLIPTAALFTIASAGHVYEIPAEAIQVIDYHQLQQPRDAERQHVQDDGYQGHQVIQTVQHQGLQAHYVPTVQDQGHHQIRVAQGHQGHQHPSHPQQPGIAYHQSSLVHQPRQSHRQAAFGHQSGLSHHQSSLGHHQSTLGHHQASLGHQQISLGHQQASLDHQAGIGHQASLGHQSRQSLHQSGLGLGKIQEGQQQGGLERTARILSHQYDSDGHNYQYAYETENGIKAQEVGAITDKGTQAQGAYSYVGDDGQTYTVTYTADETGFHPQGAHLPTPPPIPEAIARAVEQNLKDEANGIVDDGQYKEQQGGLHQGYQEQSYQQGHLPQQLQQQQQYVHQQQHAQDYVGPAPVSEHY